MVSSSDDNDNSDDNRWLDLSLLAYLTSSHSHSHLRFGWILDGGSMNHICTNCTAFATFMPAHDTIQGIVKNGPKLEVLGMGTVLISVSVKGRPDWIIKLLNVSYCPNAWDNLMSESQMDQKGMEIMKWGGQLTIKQLDNEVVMEGWLCRNLYEINCAVAPPFSHPNVAFSAWSAPNLNLWHALLGHISLKSLCYLEHHNLVTGMELHGSGELVFPCNGCTEGKHHQAPFPKSTTNCATRTIEWLHMELQGPFDTSVQGFTNTLGMIDNHSRKGWKEFLWHKNEAPELIKALIEQLENYTDQWVKIVWSDRGGEFINARLGDYFWHKRISHEYTAPHTPQQNGVAEQFNQTTHESALAMLEDSEMSKGFWPEVHEYANYVRNCSWPKPYPTWLWMRLSMARSQV